MNEWNNITHHEWHNSENRPSKLALMVGQRCLASTATETTSSEDTSSVDCTLLTASTNSSDISTHIEHQHLHHVTIIYLFIYYFIYHASNAAAHTRKTHTQYKTAQRNIKQAVRVATHNASAPCKLIISLHLFTRWRCCSDITISSYLFARWHLFRHVGYLRHQQQVDLWPFNLESVT